MWITFLLVLMVPRFAFSQVSTMKCEPLDPRANISKETETKINASVKTVLKIVQAGGEVQKKAKEEIQNIPATATSRDQIQARWIYLFCEMLRTSGNLSEAHKKQYFDAVINAIKPTSQPPSTPKGKQGKDPTSGLKEPNMTVVGALPIHLWEKFQGPEGSARSGGTKATFTNSQLGFIIKIQNNTNSPIRVNVAVLDGCVAVPLHIAREMLIKGETLPERLIFDEAYAELQKTTIQRARVSGTIRPDSRDIPASGIGYIGILFPLPGGKSGALFMVPETVSTKGKCDAIKKSTSQPAVSQLFESGPVRFMFPDIAPELRDGRIKIRLHMGNEVLEVNPKDLGKLYSVRVQHWSSLLFPEMYEVPDDDFPPVEGLLKPRN